MKDLMKSKKVIGKIPCTKQPYSIIQFLALSSLCCFFVQVLLMLTVCYYHVTYAFQSESTPYIL